MKKEEKDAIVKDLSTTVQNAKEKLKKIEEKSEEDRNVDPEYQKKLKEAKKLIEDSQKIIDDEKIPVNSKSILIQKLEEQSALSLTDTAEKSLPDSSRNKSMPARILDSIKNLLKAVVKALKSLGSKNTTKNEIVQEFDKSSREAMNNLDKGMKGIAWERIVTPNTPPYLTSTVESVAAQPHSPAQPITQPNIPKRSLFLMFQIHAPCHKKGKILPLR